MAYTAIDDPSAHFQADTYTGGQTITFDGNSDLQPDWIWIKARTTAEKWRAFDTSRGIGNGANQTKGLVTSNAETEESYDIVTSMDSDGVTLNTGDAYLNSGSHTYLLSAWKANGGSRTTNAEDGNNPAGGYQANTTAGFSIVDYVGTGAAGTMAHGLGAAPDLIIIKNRDVADTWAVYHSANTSAPETDYLILDTDAATADDDAYWNDTAPTSTVFTINTAHNVNADAENYIAYCFAPIQGYSKFGSYTGNGDEDGPFIYTGFKPAWLLIKENSGVENWRLYDNKRSPFNVMDKQLFPHSASSEATSSSYYLDFLSNGFKIRSSHGGYNTDDDTYIYMAFAESPFVTSGGVPCTAF